MTAYKVELIEVQGQAAAVVRRHVTMAEIPAFIRSAFGEVLEALSGQGLSPAGPPFARYARAGDGFEVEAGFPATGMVAASGGVVACELPGGPTAQVLHKGDYEGVAAAYDAASRWVTTHGYVANGSPWESYLDGPEVADPRTVVSIPCRRR